MAELEILVYVDSRGPAPFESWFRELDAQAQAKVTVALDHFEARQCLECRWCRRKRF
jgi:hypothetical protein